MLLLAPFASFELLSFSFVPFCPHYPLLCLIQLKLRFSWAVTIMLFYIVNITPTGIIDDCNFSQGEDLTKLEVILKYSVVLNSNNNILFSLTLRGVVAPLSVNARPGHA